MRSLLARTGIGALALTTGLGVFAATNAANAGEWYWDGSGWRYAQGESYRYKPSSYNGSVVYVPSVPAPRYVYSGDGTLTIVHRNNITRTGTYYSSYDGYPGGPGFAVPDRVYYQPGYTYYYGYDR
jgi:hypothetical protein